MLSTMKKRSLILKGVVQLRCLGLCRGNSLCMTCSGMFGAGARPRTRLLRRLHEHGIDGYGLRSWMFMLGEARFVSRGLSRTEGWNGAAAFGEGRWRRNVKWKPNHLQFDLQVKTTTRRSSGKAARQAAAFRGRARSAMIPQPSIPFSAAPPPPLRGCEKFGMITYSRM